MAKQEKSATKMNQHLAKAKAGVDEVVSVLEDSIKKLAERELRLEELNERTENLEQGACLFERQSRLLRQMYWRKNLKLKLYMSATGFVLFIVIIVWATSGIWKSKASQDVQLS